MYTDQELTQDAVPLNNSNNQYSAVNLLVPKAMSICYDIFESLDPDDDQMVLREEFLRQLRTDRELSPF